MAKKKTTEECKVCGRVIFIAVDEDGKRIKLEPTTEVYRMAYPGPADSWQALKAKSPAITLFIPHWLSCAKR